MSLLSWQKQSQNFFKSLIENDMQPSQPSPEDMETTRPETNPIRVDVVRFQAADSIIVIPV